MDLFDQNIDWNEILKPLIIKYKEKKHPLEYNNIFELIVAVLLSAQDSDAHVNKIMPKFLEKYPNLQQIKKAKIEDIQTTISDVINSKNKANWIYSIGQNINDDLIIPLNLKELIKLKGIGRKSANVILNVMKKPAEGIICDLHVIRVSSRIGLTKETKDGNKIEMELMQKLNHKTWNDIGMALSFLGREICRPTKPKCSNCIINSNCNFYNQ
ncbi:endonuclease III [Flavobacterium sp.]|uniref:endonuclease III domain-containing protein n=1 Tax=Flavobacterium sp. TaxID=239 RepID=UPI0035AFDC28